MSESTALPDPAQESPLDTASSSSSEAAEQVSLSTRLTTLAVLEQQIASLLTSAFQALDALNPAINPGDSAVASRSDHFSHHTEAYLDTLEVRRPADLLTQSTYDDSAHLRNSKEVSELWKRKKSLIFPCSYPRRQRIMTIPTLSRNF